jgi:hypothetical protein
MCNVYNSIGCLTVIKAHLRRNDINDFNSLNEVVNFQKNYLTYRQEIVSSHEKIIEQEKTSISADILQLESSIHSDKVRFENLLNMEIEALEQKLNNFKDSTTPKFLQKFFNRIRQWYYQKKIDSLKISLSSRVDDLIRKSVELHQEKRNRYQYITSRFTDAVNESCAGQLKELDRKKRIVDEVKTSIYGALGEHKVVKELKNLSDDNVLINDFSLTFSPAIFNRQENDFIKSIQIDHILVSPSGIFLIETKNWSEKSLRSLDLRSPVQQVKRTSFALFKLLSGDIAHDRVKINKHHWGDRKIPMKNLIVLTNTKPNVEFQYVKVLTLNQLLGYIRYFKPMFTTTETEAISSYLLNLNDMKHINTKS